MTVEQFENDILTLAMRKVATPEGAKKYGQPIGTYITADMEAAAKASGKTFDVPEDKPGTPSGKGKFMQGTISGKAQAEKTAPKPPPAAKPLNLKIKSKPSLTGNQHFTVGSGKFSAPNGSKLIRPAGNPALAYVVTPDGKVYSFIEAGEIEIPKVLEAVYKSKFTTDFEGDENYEVTEFEKSSASFAMDQLKVGTILSDAEGNPQFKKLAEDAWEHVDLGVKLKDEDLQDLYDEGDLIPDSTDEDAVAAEETFADVEAVNFSEMSKDEAMQALTALPVDQKITVGDTVWTKVSAEGFKNEEGKGATPASLSYVKNQIKIGADPEPEYNPLDAETKNPLDSNPTKLIGDQPDGEWMDAALPGAQIEFANDSGDKTTWTKEEEGDLWSNQKGGKLSHEQLKSAAEGSGGKGLTIKKEGKPPKESAAKPAPAAAEEPKPDWSEATDEQLNEALANGEISYKKFKEIQAEKFPKITDLTPESTKEETLSILAAAEPGTQVHPTDSEATLTKVNDDASELENYGDIEAMGGYWQSDITGKLLPSIELAEYWKGDLVAGPGSNASEAPVDPAAPAFKSQSEPPLTPGVMYSDSMSPLEVSAEKGFVPGDYDFLNEATQGDIQSAQPGDKFLLGNSLMEAESDDEPNVWDAVDVVEKQEDGSWKSLAYPDGPEAEQDALEQLAEMQSYEEQPDQIWAFQGNTLNKSTAEERPSAPATLDEAIQSDDQGLLDDSTFELTPEQSGPELKKWLDGQEVGHVIHGVTPTAKGPLEMTKQSDGSWKSSITNKSLSSKEAAVVGGYEDGPSPTDEVVEQKVKAPSQGELQEMPDGQQLVSPDGTKYATKVDKHSWEMYYTKGKFSKAPDGLQYTKGAQELIEKGWTISPAPESSGGLAPGKYSNSKGKAGTDVHMVVNADGTGTYYGKDYSPYDAESKGQKLTAAAVKKKFDTGMSMYQGTPYQEAPSAAEASGSVEYDPAIPVDAVKITSLGEVAPGTVLYEDDPELGIYVHTKDENGMFTTILPSGMKVPGNTSQDVVEIFNNGESTFYATPTAADPDSLEALRAAGAGEDSDASVAVPEGAVEFDQSNPPVFDVDDVVHEVTPGGNHLISKKQADGSWVTDTSSGNEISVDESDVIGGPPTNKFYVEKALKSEKTWAVGDIIGSTEDLDALTPGTKLAYEQNSGKISYYSSLGNGYLLTPGGNQMSTKKLTWATSQGKLSIHELMSTPDAPAAPEETTDVDAPEATAPEAPSTEKNTQLWTNAPAMSQEQLQSALEGLEAHPSFHVKYGLKDLPATNPLTNPQTQEELKFAAMEKYPDLKAKPAVVKFLKDALGLNEPEGNWEDELLEPLPKVTLGSKTPKKVGVQGMDGGEYTTYEIQDAINILEAYPGKLFKNELNKKGNPLGELDPTQIVGFDKDKLVMKQKFIDLLKTKLIVQEEQVKHPVISDFEEFKNLPVGATVISKESNGKEFHWTKISEEQWSWDDPDFEVSKPEDKIVGQNAFKNDVLQGMISLEKLPDVVPDYAKTPPAVQSKEKTQYDVNDSDFGILTLMEAEQGTTMALDDGEVSSVLEKGEGDQWTLYNADTGAQVGTWTSKKVMKSIFDQLGKDGVAGWQFKDVDTTKFNANQDFSIIPGKYVSPGGAAYLVVNADGSGTYVSSSGAVSPLNAEQVKSNYDAGMNSYQGLTADADVPKVAPKKSPVVNKPKTVASIPDGAYFGGDPSDAKTSYYEVTGDDVKIFKPLTGISSDTGVKVGANPNTMWLEAAGMGASFEVGAYWESGETKPARLWTKGSDGLWHGQNTSGDVDADIEPVKVPEYQYWMAKVLSHGVGEPTTIEKKKLNTLFAQGKIQDQYGMGVVPEGYTGMTAFFGVPANVPSLVMAQTWLNGPEAEAVSTVEFQNKLQQLGVSWNIKNWTKWRKSNGLMDAGYAGAKTAMQKALDDILTNVDTEIPESSTTDLFEWDPMGKPVYPLELASMGSTYGLPEKKAWIKEAAKHIGDGKVVGQHLSKMPGYELDKWISAFQAGDFEKMYNLEVAGAAKEGKAHSAGYLHPGFPDNTETKQVKWAAAVPGEISALEDVPGVWSSNLLDPSMDEVNNYLIAAQMQNPTYLSSTEKRQWYNGHKNSNKPYVDQLSATAALRKKNGEAQLSDPPVWTDDVKPAKSYDKLFEENALPVDGWGLNSASEYVKDQKDNDALQAVLAEKLGEGYNGSGAAYAAVQEYFKAEHEKHELELAKVIYKKSPVQKVEKGTHPIFEYDDFNGLGPIGNHYFFKPSPQGDQYRSQAEHLGHEFGWTFGFNTAQSELTTLDGKYGQLQKDLGGVSDLAKFDMSTLTANQIADIGREHILDWFLDNDDTHSANMKVLSDGSIVGIDKGRAFKHFGKWQGLNPNAMNSNTQTVYSKLFTAIQSGKLSKEDVDKAYLAIQKRAVQMSKVSDEKISEMLAEGMKNRTVWDVSYTVNGKPVPNSLKGLTAAVLDRKNKLPEQIEGMWSKVYADAGFGALPDPPAAKLGTEHYSGIGEGHFHEAAFAVNAGGVSALVGGNFSTTGTATAWGTTNSDGTKNMYTQVELNHLADEKVFSKLQAMAPGAISGPANPGKFSEEEYGGFFTRDYYRAMATIVKHNDDKEYNADRISDYNAAKVRLQKDLDVWKPVMPETSDGLIKFPSGAEVPTPQLIQYKMMLDFYKAKEASMDASVLTKAEFPINQKSKFEAYELTPKPKVWNHFDGEMSMVGLADGGALWSSQNLVQKKNKFELDALMNSGEWIEMAPPAEGPKNYGGASIKLSSETFERKGEWDNDTGIIKASTQNVGSWAKGTEYHIELPTGEKIYFRNRAKTDTFKSQYGRLTFEVPKSADSAAYAAGLERAQAWASTYLGLDVADAEEEDAELTYWKQMLPSLTRRKLTGQAKYQAAFKDIEKKAKEIGSTTDDFGIRFGDNATATEQNAFYREVWGKHFGKAKVDKLIADRAYLPEYEATDIHAPSDVVQGRPAWMRFDITLADLLAKDSNAFVASHNTGGSDSAKLVAVSGTHLSTEERIRFFGGKAGGSSSSDQDMGTGGQDQFTRIWNDPSQSGYDYVYHPKVALRTTSRFFTSDAFGSENSEKDSGLPDPLTFWKNNQSNSGSLGGGNQFSVRWASSWMNSLEMVLFDNAADRDYAIQKLKLAGLDMIRGLPVEDRLVMRTNRVAAIAKLRAQWQKEAAA